MDTNGHRRTPTDHDDKTQAIKQTFPSPNERLVFLSFFFFFNEHILGPTKSLIYN